jgi:hypothetical protein
LAKPDDGAIVAIAAEKGAVWLGVVSFMKSVSSQDPQNQRFRSKSSKLPYKLRMSNLTQF